MADQRINIVQTHSEREIIKQAPDMIVYFDGLPYVINDFIGDQPVLVNINDYVASISGSCDVDSLIAQAQLGISCDVADGVLFQGPGGQRVLKAMTEVRIFCKGYYLTQTGETVYHRVFRGLVAGITYANNKKTLEIGLTLKGILRLMEITQMNTAPSVVNAQNTGGQVTAFVDRDHDLSYFNIIVKAFNRPLSDDVIDQTSLVDQQNTIGLGPGDSSSGAGADAAKLREADYLTRTFISKWNKALIGLRQGVRIYGVPESAWTQDSTDHAQSPQAKDGGKSTQELKATVDPKTDEVTRNFQYEYGKLAKFLPFNQIGTMTLTESVVVSRLERIRAAADLMGFEAYQDLDGSIIFKPPLYNLDCTYTKIGGATPQATQLARNPFVIHESEMLDASTETENEDQIRLTRMVVRGMIADTAMPGAGDDNIVAAAAYMDPVLVRQFGIRQEPPKTLSFLTNDSKALLGFAAAELTKINRRYRTFSCTIPIRPELKLGFTMFVPSLDIYGYLENISWTYNRGGSATMTLGLTAIRWREMFAKPKTSTVDGVPTQQWIYTAVPNLILNYTEVKNPSDPMGPDSENKVQTTNPTGAALTSGTPKAIGDPSPDQQQRLQREDALKNLEEISADTTGMAWRIADDKVGDSGGAFFAASTPPAVDGTYLTKLRTAMPYTDAKGYIVQRPFPWGRFIYLEDALDAFTRSDAQKTGRIFAFETAVNGEPTGGTASAADSSKLDNFLLSGLATPQLGGDPTKTATSPTDSPLVRLKGVQEFVNENTTCFTLDFDPTAVPPGGSTGTAVDTTGISGPGEVNTNPSVPALDSTSINTASLPGADPGLPTKVDTFVSGGAAADWQGV